MLFQFFLLHSGFVYILLSVPIVSVNYKYFSVHKSFAGLSLPHLSVSPVDTSSAFNEKHTVPKKFIAQHKRSKYQRNKKNSQAQFVRKTESSHP